MRSSRVSALAMLFCASAPLGAAVPTPGDLVALRVSDPSGTPSSSSVAMTLLEFAPAGGAPVQSFSFDTTGPSALSIGGSAVTEGHLTYNDGYIGLGGYVADAGTPDIVSSSTSTVLRKALGFHIAADLAAGPRISATTTSHSGGNIRGSIAIGNDFYTFGGTQQSPLFLPAGSSAVDGVAITSGLNNIRSINVIGGNTYVANHPTKRGVYEIAGTSTTSGTPNAIVANTASADNNGQAQDLGDFWITPDFSAIYVADDSFSSGGTIPRGGIKKYVKNDTGYAFAYQISTDYDADGPATSGARYFAVDSSGTNPLFYVTSLDGTRILTLSDMGDAETSAATLTTLLTADANTWFRGVVLVPSLVPGDASGDGRVDADDFATIDRGFAAGLSGWSNGDFNKDGTIDARDYLLIDTTYAVTHPLPAAFLASRAAQFGDAYVASLLASVPEPAAVALLSVGAFGLFVRRRRPAACVTTP